MKLLQGSIFTASLLFIYINSFSQAPSSKLPVDKTTKLITYEGVKQLAGAGKDSLYRKALSWCNSYFANPTDVIREQDAAGGKIICKARFKVMNAADKDGLETDGGIVQYTLNLLFRDGRYKYTITEFNWKQTSYYPLERWMDATDLSYKPEFDYYLMQTDTRIKEIINDLVKAMSEKAVVKKDDW